MKLVVGLGNPGTKYLKNRHNAGFLILDECAKNEGLDWKFSQDFMGHFVKKGEVVFFKPTTFMNDSGSAVKNISDFYHIKKDDVLVVYDEVDLPFGKIRLAFDGLSAGHKGIDSIIKGIGGADFAKLRVGIGRPKEGADVSLYVLQDFTSDEQKELPKITKSACEAVSSFLADGIDATMNKFN